MMEDDTEIALCVVVAIAIIAFVIGIFSGINYANSTSPFQKTTLINHSTSDMENLCYRGDTGWYYAPSTTGDLIVVTSIDQPYNLSPDFCNNRAGYEKWSHPSPAWWNILGR